MTKWLLPSLGLFALTCTAQQSLTLEQCEEALQKNNFELLAARFEISAAQAAVVQAKIWEQPYLSIDVNAYNPQDKEYFDVGKNGQKAIILEQLIYMGGKKKNEIRLAKTNAELEQLEFEELLYNLKFELRKSFYGVYFDQKKITAIDNQLGQLESLLAAYETQADKGNIALKEVVRLQSLVLNLKNDRLDILQSDAELRQSLSLLTGIEDSISPIIDEGKLIGQFQVLLLQKSDLLPLAQQSNPEYLIAQKTIEAQSVDIKLQKSLAVPDITVGANYDQNSGAFRDQVNVSVAFPIPLWNKNKGNIKIAQAELEKSKAQSSYKTLELKSRIETAYTLWSEQKDQVSKLKPRVTENLESVNQGIFSNFLKRNISLYEFTDFLESYNLSMLQINELYKQLILSGESLNHLVNTAIF